MSYDNIITSEQPLFRIRNCFTAVKGESPQSDTACFQFSNDLQDRGQ